MMFFRNLVRSAALLGAVATGMWWGTGDAAAQDLAVTVARQAEAVAASAVPPQIAVTSLKSIAGEYSFGNGFDLNCSLVLRPSGEFHYQQIDCAEVVKELRGTVAFANGRLELKSAEDPGNWLRGTGPTLVPVPWGQRLYLVPGNDLLGFCNQVNRGIEPVSHGSTGSYFLREGDWDREATGRPGVPQDWSHYILGCPASGQVTGRDTQGRWQANFGQSQGVYLGMEVVAQHPSSPEFTVVKVTEVGPNSCTVELVGDEGPAAIDRWALATRQQSTPCR